MREDQFCKLLSKADVPAAEPTLPGDLPQRVRALLQRRRRTRLRLLAATPAALGLLCAGAWYFVASGRQPKSVAELAQAAAKAALSASNEADFHQLVARQIRELEELDRARDEISTYQPGLAAREELERVAYRMILEADALRAREPEADRAVGVYRDVMQLFPKTNSAAIARERLATLDGQ